MSVMSVDVPSSAVAAVGESAPVPRAKKRSWVTGAGYGGVVLGTLLIFFIPGMKAGRWQDLVIVATVLTLLCGAALVVLGLVWNVIRS